jgi:hypothetical protein
MTSARCQAPVFLPLAFAHRIGSLPGHRSCAPYWIEPDKVSGETEARVLLLGAIA